MNGADLVVRGLVRHGVRVLFGMPGSHTTALYDAVLREGSIRTVLVRNEQAAAFAADGYARVTGTPGVVCTTAGPGATNALTGVAEAWADTVPVLLVTGQVNHDRLHQECGNYHEIDLEGILRPCTKFVTTVMANEDVPAAVSRAFAAMTHGRPRPAALVLPQDLMALPAPDTDVSPEPPPPTPRPRPDAVREAVRVLSASRRPVIVAGGGAVWSGAADGLRAVAARLGAPVLTTLNGKGILDERDPVSLGHVRSARGKWAVTRADAMLAIGCRFTEVTTGFRTMPVPRDLVQIDIDPGQIGMNHPVAVGLACDAAVGLAALADALPATGRDSSWWAPARQETVARPEWLIETLRRELPDDAVVFTDACEMGYRAQADYPAYRERSFFYPSNYITLGWGFPAAVGAAVALPGVPVVSLSGDGGFGMTAQELVTAARYRLRLVAVVHNDGKYGAIRNLQRRKHESRFIDTDLGNPDFVKLADACGVPGERAADAATLAAALRRALGRDEPTLIEVPDEWRSLRDG
jgi:thiamine pyrophosphate-dependent acetolactate synthase large subunit-like protein